MILVWFISAQKWTVLSIEYDYFANQCESISISIFIVQLLNVHNYYKSIFIYYQNHFQTFHIILYLHSIKTHSTFYTRKSTSTIAANPKKKRTKYDKSTDYSIVIYCLTEFNFRSARKRKYNTL